MTIVTNIVIGVLFVLFPALVIWLSRRFKLIAQIGIVLICYLCGMIVGNLGLLPESFGPVQSNMQDISVCLALPFMLFSMDLKSWFKSAKTAILSLVLSMIALLAVVTALHLILGRTDPDTAQYAGLAMGVYTGGTPNIASIKTVIGASEDTYMRFVAYDTVVSMFYLLFVVSVAQKVFQKVFGLRPYQAPEGDAGSMATIQGEDTCEGIFARPVFKKLCLAFLLSAAILGVSYVLGTLVPGYETAVTILSITTLSIACSFIKPVRAIEMTASAGMYIIYIFCFTVATMADFSQLVNINWVMLGFVAGAIFGTMLLHAVLCRVFKVDSDTMIVTSVSAICSPPFVPVAVNALKNNAVLVSGLVTGIIGYAAGNYLGILVNGLFQLF